jgi:hypothetical protein
MQPPSAEQLQQLPLRAIVAYAARSAKRIAIVLRGVLPDEVINDALDKAELFVTQDCINPSDAEAVLLAASRVASASSELRSKSDSVAYAALSVFAVATACGFAIAATTGTEQSRAYRNWAAFHAASAASFAKALEESAAQAALTASATDYETLLAEYGEHEEVIVGKPIHCFDDVPE